MKRFPPEQIRFALAVCMVVLAIAMWRYIQARL
jgi:hypothetical protein